MTREEAIERVKTMRWEHATNKDNPDHEAMTMAIEALEQEPCDDVVSRQALLEFFKDDDYVVNEINNMPSVLPKREQGEWIKEFNDMEGEVRFTCSSCGKYQLFPTDFCPECGAEMR